MHSGKSSKATVQAPQKNVLRVVSKISIDVVGGPKGRSKGADQALGTNIDELGKATCMCDDVHSRAFRTLVLIRCLDVCE